MPPRDLFEQCDGRRRRRHPPHHCFNGDFGIKASRIPPNCATSPQKSYLSVSSTVQSTESPQRSKSVQVLPSSTHSTARSLADTQSNSLTVDTDANSQRIQSSPNSQPRPGGKLHASPNSASNRRRKAESEFVFLSLKLMLKPIPYAVDVALSDRAPKQAGFRRTALHRARDHS